MTERQSLRNELRENFYRPFWGAKKQSPTSLDGVVRCFPSESPVGPLTRPTGLSRTQQLLVLNAMNVALLPSFCQAQGGLALDRAIPLIGTARWWTALLFRVKAQQCFQQGGANFTEKIRGVGRGENYCLSLRSKARVGSRTSIEGSMETDNASHLRRLFAAEEEAEERPDHWEGIGGRLEIAHKFDLYKLLISCAFRERFQTQGTSLTLPAVLSTEVISNDLHKPFHFRLGLHQILDLFPEAPDVVHDCSHGMYLQGGLGMDGVVTLLKSPRIKRKTRQDRLDQMRETKLSGLSFDRPFSKDRRSSSSHSDAASVGSSQGLPSAEHILKKLQDRVASLNQSSESLSKATKDVQSGKLKEIQHQMEKNLSSLGRGIKGRAFLPPSHLKIGGLAGVVASFGFHKDGLERVSFAEGPSTSVVRRWSNQRWRSAVEDHPVKGFVGCSLSAQLGRMRRRILSFTSALVQCECTVPIRLGQASLPRRIQGIAASHRRTLMIGSVPVRPLLNISLMQQVFGPIRVKADYRVAMEPSLGIGSMANMHPANAFLRQLHSIRPSVVDTQYGVDFVVPGTQGAIKFCAWYAPFKKEAMAELRLF